MTGEAQYSDSLGVLVVDDQRLMRDGIASLLEIQPGLEVLGTAASGEEALEKALALRPDVILMDVRMPGIDGVAATRQILQQLPSCRILMLTTFDDDEYVIEALRAGASGYLLKDIPAQDLARAVQALHKGIYQLDPAVAGKLVSALGGSSSLISAETSAKSPTQSVRDAERERAEPQSCEACLPHTGGTPGGPRPAEQR